MSEYMTTHHRAPRMVLAAAGGKSWYRLVLSQQGTATANGQTYEGGGGGGGGREGVECALCSGCSVGQA